MWKAGPQVTHVEQNHLVPLAQSTPNDTPNIVAIYWLDPLLEGSNTAG